MAGIFEADNSFAERNQIEELRERKLSSSPTWRELIEILAKMQALSDTLEMHIAQLVAEGREENPEDIINDIYTKNGWSIRGREIEVKNLLIEKICKGIV